MENVHISTGMAGLYLAHNFISADRTDDKLTSVHLTFDGGFVTINAINGHACGSFRQTYMSSKDIPDGTRFSIRLEKGQIKHLKPAKSGIKTCNIDMESKVIELPSGINIPIDINNHWNYLDFSQFYCRASGLLKSGSNDIDYITCIPIATLKLFDFSSVLGIETHPVIRKCDNMINFVYLTKDELPFEFIGCAMSIHPEYRETKTIPEWAKKSYC